MPSLLELTSTCETYMHQHPDTKILSIQEAKDIYPRYIDCINGHNELYYQKAEPIITDKQWDDIFAYLKQLESTFPEIISPTSPTQQLVKHYQKIDAFDQASHTSPLLSLENSYNAEDLNDFDTFIERQLTKAESELVTAEEATYTLEPKFDGISIELIYKKGKFHQAITRGDGTVGDDVTHNVSTITNLPKTLTGTDIPALLSVRGEILMPKSTRKEINEVREADGLAPFANTRNATAGSIKLLDANIVAQRGLVCYIYDLLAIQKNSTDPIVRLHEDKSDLPFQSHSEARKYLQDVGLPLFDWYKETNDIQSVIDYCTDNKTEQELIQSDIEFDGIVIKLNNIYKRSITGSTNHHPRRGMAYKFPAQQAATQIASVDFQVGRTGIITPVANLTPTELGGVTISRVSLHNFDFIQQKDIHEYDWVWIQRSGEVIPYVVGSIKERRDNKSGDLIQAPTVCPSCDKQLVAKETFWYCNNPSCPAKLKEQCKHFVHKNCMNIDGLGESILELLISQKLITSLPDLYSLGENDKHLALKSLPGIGSKKVENMATELEKSKHNELRRIINAIGIPHIGKKMAQSIQESIAEQIGEETVSFGEQELLNFLKDKEFLDNIYGVGDVMVESMITYCHSHQYIFTELAKHGVQFNNFGKKNKNRHGPLSGIHFGMTGTFPISRDNLVEQFEAQGATFDSSPGKKTNIMLIGEKAGSKKQKAEKLGITIYEGREKLKKQFKFLENISPEKTKTEETITQTSLFG